MGFLCGLRRGDEGSLLLVTNPFIREENGNIRISATFPGILLQRYLEGGSHMCTSITWKNGDFYFGRNMDLEYSLISISGGTWIWSIRSGNA